MLECDRTDVNKWEDTSKKCSLCQYYCFGFKNFSYKDIYAMGVMICL